MNIYEVYSFVTGVCVYSGTYEECRNYIFGEEDVFYIVDTKKKEPW